ncbi:hypothetical protein RvY_16341-2 [Ramazzottius varieornatus]|uniref:Cytochrome P450 n=1 Tax=Ramazzottius varieornatus TaxID=947166 RepID=A0A1D1W5R6_RAMVA|nr:hypothetical protein RvY_16341-2 [Ramazzottius varieornatus]
MKEILDMRKFSGQVRRDFLQLMVKALDETEASQQQSTKQSMRPTDNFPEDEEDGADVLSGVFSPAEISSPSDETHSSPINRALSIDEVLAQSIIFFVAGFETSATTLTFMTYLLAIHPEIQEKLRKEIDQAIGKDVPPTYDLISRIPYLDQCINETLRMYPPATRTERENSEEWTYGNLTLDKGTIIAIPIYAIQHDSEYWPEPDSFNPDRFSEENKHKIVPFTFLPFGQGPRNCAGMRCDWRTIHPVVRLIVNICFPGCTSHTRCWSRRSETPLMAHSRTPSLKAENLWILPAFTELSLHLR